MKEFDLLPEKYRVKRLWPARLTSISLGTIICIGFVLFMELALAREGKRGRITELTNEFKLKKSEMARLNREITTLRKQLRPFFEVAPYHDPWSSVLIDIAGIVKERAVLTKLSADSEKSRCTISGKVLDPSILSVLVHQLDELPYFDSAVLISVSKTATGKTRIINFEITCTFRELAL
ncbi:MAG: PilN domain-containing protein [Thermoplasmata archaeon]|nr:PilN domain-containing protein [Thermoplasmata archaeon]